MQIKYLCLINNYNNEAFLRECLESVFSQSRAFDLVIVVDDGSTDTSFSIISDFCKRYQNLLAIRKPNEGQFSTFNAALPLISDDTQIFLLDGDDVYPPDYLELMVGSLGHKGWDFAFCEQQVFLNDSAPPNSALISSQPPHYFSTTSALTRSRGCWIGNPTSCISLSSELFKKVFPYPYYQDRSFWADNLIIYASSILGAKKVYVPSLGVGWRNHASNDSKRRYSQEDVLIKELAINQAFEWYCSKFNIPRYPRILEFLTEYQNLGPYWLKRLGLPSAYRMLNRLLRKSIKQFFMNKFKRN
jgi:glycosyltransferase involved in cell wall biosynthesis